MFLQDAATSAFGFVLQFINPGSRIFVLYLLTAFVLAFVAYWQVESAHRKEAEQEGEEFPERVGFLQYVFNREFWFSETARQDLKYFFANALVYYGLIAQFLIGSHAASVGMFTLFSDWFGAPETVLLSGYAAIALYTVIAVLAMDFGIFLMHYLYHRIPVLWEFHKVHHSAEHLNPLTLFRMHPLDLFMTSLSMVFFQSIAYAGFFYLTAAEPEVMKIFGLNLFVFFFYVFGYNLRHSHIWLNFPVWLSKILVSPAQHQIHHSSDPKHWDRNMGLIFSFWDQLFGTHYIPRERENLKFGIDVYEPNPFKSVSDMYLKPFVWAAELIKPWFATARQRGLVGASAFATLSLVAWAFTYQGPAMPSLKLEKLTWTEIQKAMDAGYDSVIIPTGGTEQNGPFVMLGKHNIIIDHTSKAIASKVGNTLIAPVMAYVPEGEWAPEPKGHMRFAGTLSLSPETFQRVLEETARSLKAHGFKQIFFLGDSLGNQESQQKIAAKLSAEWNSDGITVASLDDYYAKNGQFAWLEKKGFKKAHIGYHAGMRDSSEVMALTSSGVRIRAANQLDGYPPSFSGDISKASKSIGRKMLKLKIQAGVRQIQAIRATRAPAAALVSTKVID